MMDWQDIHFFAVLAQTGSLSGAARVLNVDHATVGRRLDALEQSLGLRLVHRLPRSRPLTADGQAIAALAGDMDNIAALLQRRSQARAMDITGIVRISAPPALAIHIIAPTIATLMVSHPKLRVVSLPSLAMAALDKGEADIALRTLRPEDSALMRRKIGTVRFALYGTPRVAALAEQDLTFIAYDPTMNHLPPQAWLHQIRGDRPIVFAASDLLSQQIAARCHVGALVLPTTIGDNDRELIRIPTAIASPARDIWMTTYPGLRRSPAIRTVMDFLADCVQRDPHLRITPKMRPDSGTTA